MFPSYPLDNARFHEFFLRLFLFSFRDYRYLTFVNCCLYIFLLSFIAVVAMASNGVARRGRVAVLLGAQWGDEGKGKIIDYLIDHDKVREILVI